MKDISARELKGHNILAVERFWDNTRWMIEFSVLRPSTAYGSPGEEMRLFLTEDGYQAALQSQQRREIKIKRWLCLLYLCRGCKDGCLTTGCRSRYCDYRGCCGFCCCLSAGNGDPAALYCKNEHC